MANPFINPHDGLISHLEHPVEDEEGIEFPPLDELMSERVRVWIGDDEYVITQMDVNSGLIFREVNLRLRQVYRLPK